MEKKKQNQEIKKEPKNSEKKKKEEQKNALFERLFLCRDFFCLDFLPWISLLIHFDRL